jgi:lincosamide nucleotidyltransferase A/C/D/E
MPVPPSNCCIDPEWLLKFHTGYDVDETDDHDVRLLCERFGIAMPDGDRRFL